jgi:DNA processing protein
MGMTERECWFWLCTRPWLGVRSVDKLLKHFKTAQHIYYGRNTQYGQVCGLSRKIVGHLQKTEEKDEEKIKRAMFRLEQAGGHFVCRADGEYPEKLRHIYDSPAGLFYYGELPDKEQPLIAVVGAREASGYGLSAAGYFAERLTAMGMGIISGLARGIDGEAHRGALRVGEAGRTWGILGCGLNICYPPENYTLFEQMREQGGIISEYGLDVKPEPWHFPMRNRLISGLADGILIVEARERSGSLITADMGLEQGKNIYALPGRFNDALSLGCHRLIQNGAKLVCTPEDIAEDYPILQQYPKPTGRKTKLPLDKLEQLVYANLSLSPKDVDTISVQSGLSTSKVWNILLNLELKGYIHPMGKNMYMLKI